MSDSNDPRNNPIGGPIDQVGYLVGDIDAAVERWHRLFGIAPWTIYRGTHLTGSYEGRDTEVTFDVALSYRGSVQIELIALTGGGASPYSDADGTHRKGIHHTAWVVNDCEAARQALERRGLVTAFVAGNDAVDVAYLRSEDDPGAYFELIEGEGMREMIDAGIAQAKDWREGDPLIVADYPAGAS